MSLATPYHTFNVRRRENIQEEAQFFLSSYLITFPTSTLVATVAMAPPSRESRVLEFCTVFGVSVRFKQIQESRVLEFCTVFGVSVRFKQMEIKIC